MAYFQGGSGAIAAPNRRGGLAPDRAQDMSQYMEEFHKSVHNIPAELLRQLKLLKQLDEKVSELNDTIAADCVLYSAAKAKDTEEMKSLMAKIEANKKECLNTADEKVQLVVNLFTQVEGKLKELDEKMAVFDEAMLQQEHQAAEDADEEADKKSLASQGRAEKRRKTNPARDADWVVKGAKVEVLAEGDWWNAIIKKVESKTTSGSGALGAPGRVATVTRVLISYEGGTDSMDEWIDMKSGRVRPSQENGNEQPELCTPMSAGGYVGAGQVLGGGYGRI